MSNCKCGGQGCSGTGKCKCGGKCKKHEPGHVCKCKKVSTTPAIRKHK